MQNFSSYVRTFLGAAIIVSVPYGSAFAGFEFTPPAPQQVTPPMMAVPAPQVNSEVLPAPQSSALPTVEQAIMAPAPVRAAPAAAPVKQFPDRDFEVVQGFGSDIPLVLVLNQIVPAAYSYSFDGDVDPGMRVSWNGGKPWNLVLEEALAAYGFGIMIVDDVVWIRDEIQAKEVEEPALIVDSPVHILPPATHAAGMMAPPAPAAPEETATSMNEVQTDIFAPMPTQMETETPRTQSEEYNPSYPRRVPPKIDHGIAASSATPARYGAERTAAEPVNSADMPMPLMPFKKAEPKQTQQPAPVAVMPSTSRDTLPVISAVPSTGAAPAPQINAKAAQGPVLDPFEIYYWKAQKGERLRTVLHRWADEANVALIWNAEYDYELPENIAMHGTFPDVISQTLMRFTNTHPRPIGKLHPNLPAGPSVLTVATYNIATN